MDRRPILTVDDYRHKAPFRIPGPEACFSKVPETFRARKAIFSSSVSRNGDVLTPETFCMKGTSLHIENM